ncbi:MAG: hypothetical protein DKINENOH_04841 [bacterium]|nr:hypothetical protein [bacterium]
MEREFDLTVLNGPADHAKLQTVIETLRQSAQYAILEALTDIRFPYPPESEIKLVDWPKGRVFAPAFELRWEKNGGNFRSVLAHDAGFSWPAVEISTSFTPDSELRNAFFGWEKQLLYLWPENDMRLGRKLRYECLERQRDDNRKNVQLEARLYRDAHGRLIFWRYREMRWTT